VVRVFKGFRFDPKLYGDFGRLASAHGVTVTGAFERFMSVCVESGALVFPERGVGGFEAEDEAFFQASFANGYLSRTLVAQQLLVIWCVDKPTFAAHQYGEEHWVLDQFACYFGVCDKLSECSRLLSKRWGDLGCKAQVA
jgi:hypothetical protein